MPLHAVSEILRFVASALHDVLKKAPSETVLLDNYARVCIVLSEIINEVSAPALAVIPHACQASLSTFPLVWRLTNLHNHAACKMVQGAKKVENIVYVCNCCSLGLLPKGAVGFLYIQPWELPQGILEIVDRATLLRALKMKASLQQTFVHSLDGNLILVILQELHAQKVDLRSVGAQRSNVL